MDENTLSESTFFEDGLKILGCDGPTRLKLLRLLKLSQQSQQSEPSQQSQPYPDDIFDVGRTEVSRYNSASDIVNIKRDALTIRNPSTNEGAAIPSTPLPLLTLCNIDYSQFLRWKRPFSELFTASQQSLNDEDKLVLHLVDELENIAERCEPPSWRNGLYAAAGKIMYHYIASCSCCKAAGSRRCARCCILLFRLAYHYYNDCGTGSIEKNKKTITAYLNAAKHHEYASYAVGVLLASQWRLLDFDDRLQLSTIIEKLEKTGDKTPGKYLSALLQLQGWSMYKAYKPTTFVASPSTRGTRAITNSTQSPKIDELLDTITHPIEFKTSLGQLAQCKYIKEEECKAHVVLPLLRVLIFNHLMRDFAVNNGELVCIAIKTYLDIDIPTMYRRHIGCELSHSLQSDPSLKRCNVSTCCCLHQVVCTLECKDCLNSLLNVLPTTKTVDGEVIRKLCESLCNAAKDYDYSSTPHVDAWKRCEFRCDKAEFERMWDMACDHATDVLKAPVHCSMDPCAPLSLFIRLYTYTMNIRNDTYRFQRLYSAIVNGPKTDQGSLRVMSEFLRIFSVVMNAYLRGTENVVGSAATISEAGLQNLDENFLFEELQYIYKYANPNLYTNPFVRSNAKNKLTSWRAISDELWKQDIDIVCKASNAIIAQRLAKTHQKPINTTWAGVSLYDKSMKTLLDLAKEFRIVVEDIDSFVVCDKTTAALDYAAISCSDPWIKHLYPMSDYYHLMLQGLGSNDVAEEPWKKLYEDIVNIFPDGEYLIQMQAKVRFALLHYPYADISTTIGVALLRHQLRNVMNNPVKLLAACDAMILDYLITRHCEVPEVSQPASKHQVPDKAVKVPPKTITLGPATPTVEAALDDDDEADKAVPPLSLFKLPIATVQIIFSIAQFFLHLKTGYICNFKSESKATSLLFHIILYHPLSLPGKLSESVPKTMLLSYAVDKLRSTFSSSSVVADSLTQVARNVAYGYLGKGKVDDSIKNFTPHKLVDIITLLRSVIVDHTVTANTAADAGAPSIIMGGDDTVLVNHNMTTTSVDGDDMVIVDHATSENAATDAATPPPCISGANMVKKCFSIDISIIVDFIQTDSVLSKFYDANFAEENRFFRQRQQGTPAQAPAQAPVQSIAELLKDDVFVRMLQVAGYAKVHSKYWD